MAAVRLQKLKEEFGDEITISWKSFPLRPHETPPGPISQHSREARRRSGEEEKEARFAPWDDSQTYPTSSMPALEAAKCASLQGEEAFERYHMALFEAFFGKSKDISKRDVLIAIAKESELDLTKFISDLNSGSARPLVLAEAREARGKFGDLISGIPTAVFKGKYPLVGAVPLEMYRRAVKKLSKRED